MAIPLLISNGRDQINFLSSFVSEKMQKTFRPVEIGHLIGFSNNHGLKQRSQQAVITKQIGGHDSKQTTHQTRIAKYTFGV